MRGGKRKKKKSSKATREMGRGNKRKGKDI